ncbi:MAG: ribonuclease Z [Bacteroidaceae bacterium]|nr:ribonuclease Z [Bacteroidaceae bacterium]
MEKFEITVLGCGCALPTVQHNPAAQIVNIREKLSLVDCGEGTQQQLRRFKVGFNKIRNVFISHTHGDHCLGLVGMLSSFSLLGRTSPLHIYAPSDYESLFRAQLDYFCKGMEYPVEYHPLDTEKHQCVYEDRSMEVFTLPLVHRVPCCGFLFREKPTQPHILRDMVDYYGIPLSEINNIKAGADWTTPDGVLIPHARLTRPADPPRSYAYCSDTKFKPDLVSYLQGVTLLYHEATFDKSRQDRAQSTFHSTAEQAAMIARDCGARQLLIGHYSANYRDVTVLLEEARSVFPNTLAAKEGLVVRI